VKKQASLGTPSIEQKSSVTAPLFTEKPPVAPDRDPTDTDENFS
jgi:hypothetical protein